MKSILDPTFKYVPAANTDIRATFDRIAPNWRNGKQPITREQVHAQVKKNIAQFGEDSRQIWEEGELRAVQQIGKP